MNCLISTPYCWLLKMRLVITTNPTGTPCRIDVDSTWILRWYVEDQISTNYPRRFQVLLRCNFADRKIHVVSTYFFRRNLDGRKIQAVSTYFCRCNFDGQKIHLVSTRFFRCNFFHRDIQSFYLLFSTQFWWPNNPLSLHILFSTKFRWIRRRCW